MKETEMSETSAPQCTCSYEGCDHYAGYVEWDEGFGDMNVCACHSCWDYPDISSECYQEEENASE